MSVSLFFVTCESSYCFSAS